MEHFGMCFFFVSLYFFSSLKYSSSVYTDADGCSASPLLPNRPFVVVWNHPTSVCEDKGIHLDFDKWGIVDNARDRFFGQQIALFYQLGKWPFYDSKNQPVNGGLPQLSNLQAHLTKIDADLKAHVWNATFSGLGVIDMEYWRPLYWTNFDSKSIYQRQSQDLARQRFPSYNKSQILEEAIKEFNKAARDFMSQTLQKVSTKRPQGKWGYYLFPRCFDASCNTTTIRNNDRISWLFQESSALYPSIYFKLATPKSSISNQIKQTLHEAFRVKAKYSSQNIPVVPYSKSQEGPYKMYQEMDLSLAVLQPANMGSSGVVIWGSSSDARAKNECLVLQDYINNVFGPFSRNVTNFFGNCSQQLCGGQGRCVRKDYERRYQEHLRESGRRHCLLPDDILFNERKEKAACNNVFDISRKKNKTVIEEKNKVLGFLDHIKIKFQSQFKLSDELSKDSLKLSKSVINFSVKSFKGNEVGNIFSSEKDSHNPVNSNLGDSSDSNSNLNPIPPINTFTPDYDFDDYVCKCYPGYTGIHCEHKRV